MPGSQLTETSFLLVLIQHAIGIKPILNDIFNYFCQLWFDCAYDEY